MTKSFKHTCWRLLRLLENLLLVSLEGELGTRTTLSGLSSRTSFSSFTKSLVCAGLVLITTSTRNVIHATSCGSILIFISFTSWCLIDFTSCSLVIVLESTPISSANVSRFQFDHVVHSNQAHLLELELLKEIKQLNKKWIVIRILKYNNIKTKIKTINSFILANYLYFTWFFN